MTILLFSEIHTLQDLLDSDEYQNNRFGSSSDDWLEDADGMERCDAAAAYGGDGSTHGEYIQDWRDCLARMDLHRGIAAAITAEIDDCEQWHIENGSIDEEIG